jgi:FkbM family methyltransferase
MSITDRLPSLRSNSLYHPIRNAYLCLFKHEFWKSTIRDVRRFYSGFVGPGDLVFDVGANIGTYSKMFLSLGATVVAVEPTPSLIKDLQRIPRLKVEGCALGDADGVLPLSVSNLNLLNSLVPGWEKQIAGTHDGQVVNVPVTTLDALIAKYGVPDFIKIDVEGYESKVLSGLSKLPKYLSFEFHAAEIEAAIACVKRLQGCQFNYCFGEPGQLALREWVTEKEICDLLRSLPRDWQQFGDIFAARNGTSGGRRSSVAEPSTPPVPSG